MLLRSNLTAVPPQAEWNEFCRRFGRIESLIDSTFSPSSNHLHPFMRRMDSWTRAWRGATNAVFIVMAGLLVLAGMAKAEDSMPLPSSVLRVTGSARYSMDGANLRPLKRGDVIQPGCTIQTAEDGTVDLALGKLKFGVRRTVRQPQMIDGIPITTNANLLRLYPRSVLTISKLAGTSRWSWRTLSTRKAPKEIRLKLGCGKLMGIVDGTSPFLSYEVSFSNHVATIPYGTYLLGGNGQVYVLNGSARISGTEKITLKEVKSMEHFDCNTGKTENIHLGIPYVVYRTEYGPALPVNHFHGSGFGGALRAF